MFFKTAENDLHPMGKCIELQKTCFKTATFSLSPMAKGVEFQKINLKRRNASLRCQEGGHLKCLAVKEAGGPQQNLT
jgi:hypothetical protein